MYKQFVLKLTEMESLDDPETIIGLRRVKRSNLFYDLSNPEVKRSLLAEILKNIYGEGEIDYLLSLAKWKKLEPSEGDGNEELRISYEKALDTLEVLMHKLGLKDSYERVLE